MTLAQPGIFVEGTSIHRFYELVLPAAAEGAKLLAQLHIALGQHGGHGVASVLACSTSLWLQRGGNDISPLSFSHIESGCGRYHAPATQRDLFIWLHGNDRAALADAQLDVNTCLRQYDAEIFSWEGFIYRDSRDLTGFIDGSANPRDEQRLPVALIDAGPVTGGSYVMTQAWQHDLAAFNELSIAGQEQVIGRTKIDSIELTGDAMPESSHVSRTDIKHEGVAQKIYRRSTPTIDGSSEGLYFLAFSAEAERFDRLLASMYGRSATVQDSLLGYSQPRSGSYWYAPSRAQLDSLG